MAWPSASWRCCSSFPSAASPDSSRKSRQFSTRCWRAVCCRSLFRNESMASLMGVASIRRSCLAINCNCLLPATLERICRASCTASRTVSSKGTLANWEELSFISSEARDFSTFASRLRWLLLIKSISGESFYLRPFIFYLNIPILLMQPLTCL